MIREEEWWSFAQKGECVSVTHHFKHRSLHEYTIVARGQDGVEGKEHDRSCAGVEGYTVICAGCEGGERDGTRPLRPSCTTV